ncbi:MAG TPA: 30S ribosomal protein S6, partial [Roseiflexaceae bacterium]|nr:30S ribosomal protein S6 [Roseiflexaceae bacterium]
MRERRRDYELLFIVSPLRSSEEEIANTVNRVRQAIASAGGEMTDVDQTPPWGRRKFAYPIREYAEGEASRRPFNEGFYVLCHFNLASTQIPEIERALKLNDSVLRYLLTLVDTRSQSKPQPLAVGAGADAAASESFDEEDLEEDHDEAEED